MRSDTCRVNVGDFTSTFSEKSTLIIYIASTPFSKEFIVHTLNNPDFA